MERSAFEARLLFVPEEIVEGLDFCYRGRCKAVKRAFCSSLRKPLERGVGRDADRLPSDLPRVFTGRIRYTTTYGSIAWSIIALADTLLLLLSA